MNEPKIPGAGNSKGIESMTGPGPELIEVEIKTYLGYEAIGLAWTDTLTAEELEALEISPDLINIGGQVKLVAPYVIRWEEGMACPHVDQVFIFGPSGLLKRISKERISYEAIEDDISLYGDHDEWLSDRHAHEADEDFDRHRDGGF